jgi:hypothetical protein
MAKHHRGFRDDLLYEWISLMALDELEMAFKKCDDLVPSSGTREKWCIEKTSSNTTS